MSDSVTELRKDAHEVFTQEGSTVSDELSDFQQVAGKTVGDISLIYLGSQTLKSGSASSSTELATTTGTEVGSASAVQTIYHAGKTYTCRGFIKNGLKTVEVYDDAGNLIEILDEAGNVIKTLGVLG